MDQPNPQIEALEKKIDELQRSINSIKKIFFWILVISVVMFILPLIGLVFAIPQFLSIYSDVLQ